MKYLVAILLCLGISGSGWAQSYSNCGCPQTSVQLLTSPSCCGNNGNGALQFGYVYGAPSSTGCGYRSCQSPCPQPYVGCPFCTQYAGYPISVTPYCPCQNNQGCDGSCVVTNPRCPYLQQVIPGPVRVCPCSRSGSSTCSSTTYSPSSVGLPQTISSPCGFGSSCSTPVIPLSSCGCSTSSVPYATYSSAPVSSCCSCSYPTIQVINPCGSCSAC
uniref:Uncharacterized protein n=1 Tax=Lygus hesperus TaxID=30085 RepID=A0A146MAX9_LYGHE